MIQSVFVLELLRAGPGGEGVGGEAMSGGGVVRGHFAQTEGAARRAAAGKYRLEGRWEPVTDGGRVVARLVSGERVLARVVRESLSYG